MLPRSVFVIALVACLSLTACPTRVHHDAGDLATFAGIEFVWCPTGFFVMGQEESDLSAGIVETPTHAVIFTKGFWMSKHEITQQQWLETMAVNPSEFTGDDRPVDSVSWDDAQAYISALNSAHPFMRFRLPSESEWEYACRAGSTTCFYWGDDPGYLQTPNYAWFHGNSDMVTHDVGQKLANAWGLHDMSGNVWEWVQDRWHDTYDGAPIDGSAWETEQPGLGHNRVLRGAAYNYENYHCQSACRGISPHDAVNASNGFRIVRF